MPNASVFYREQEFQDRQAQNLATEQFHDSIAKVSELETIDRRDRKFTTKWPVEI